MDAAQFKLPIRLVPHPHEPVVEIYSAEEALDFLMSWPVQEGGLFERTLAACLAASADPTSTEEARRIFSSFARAVGVIARDVPLDSLYEGERLKQDIQGES
ncbi:DUF982 domain-containing protein [Chelativorans salis]|uniref:DUF982 domain-containing protein n=1 Tax=Chelativorans salis TaxID=2978478 RepID=A0ABT2LKB7_9HYPH|nr:DUF982 domain-containing protein [Chelativorans sp. EGI FJ00035]MCT7374963.1 DUF982 domain-containing protein [Chelativorans sp. EGI FJ00035]